MTHAHEATPSKLIGHHNPARVLRELARLGRVRLRRIDTYTDVAPAPSAIFAR